MHELDGPFAFELEHSGERSLAEQLQQRQKLEITCSEATLEIADEEIVQLFAALMARAS